MVTISEVDKNSPADKVGIQAGDVLCAINSHPIGDILDYRFFLTEREITLDLKRGGVPFSLSIRKGQYDDIGLNFETFLMDQKRRCSNRCIFCFIDQNPKGMRKTVYFKDDDTRLSFLMGNYVTLTNVSEKELCRIVSMRLSPVNVSVHTTNLPLRIKMLGNPKADRILDQLRILSEGKIDINCQIVSCRGINDGEELKKTLRDLERFYPALQSIAVVPAGLTQHREGLTKIEPYDRKSALELIQTVEKFAEEFKERYGTRLVWAADEFYLAAGLAIPEDEFYEEFSQLDNGVGLLRNSETEISEELEWRLREGGWKDFPAIPREITVATGVAAEKFMNRICQSISEALPFLRFRVVPVVNRFFGESVTVAGLICGGDLLETLRPLSPKTVFIPAVALRHERDRFLDDVTLEDVRSALGCPVIPIENGADILDHVESLLYGR